MVPEVPQTSAEPQLPHIPHTQCWCSIDSIFLLTTTFYGHLFLEYEKFHFELINNGSWNYCTFTRHPVYELVISWLGVRTVGCLMKLFCLWLCCWFFKINLYILSAIRFKCATMPTVYVKLATLRVLRQSLFPSEHLGNPPPPKSTFALPLLCYQLSPYVLLHGAYNPLGLVT